MVISMGRVMVGSQRREEDEDGDDQDDDQFDRDLGVVDGEVVVLDAGGEADHGGCR